MAQHASAAKRARQNVQRRARNQTVTSGVRTAVKAFREAIKEGDKKVIEDLFGQATRALRQAASKGVLHKRNADRRVSRLALAKNASAK